MCSGSGVCDAMGGYIDQEDVDRAFADYDRSMLIVHPRPAAASRDRLLCRGCGGSNYHYDTPVGGEPGARVCCDCGVVAEGRVIFEAMYGRFIPPRTSNYKRIHHWHERISQLLLMESKIPADHLLEIGRRLTDGSYSVINKDTIRAVLRSLGMQIYIEKWLQIIERITGVMPPCPGPMVLQQLDRLFTDLQRPFAQHKLAGRRNFLNYNYVFCRLFQKMGCNKFCMFFPLIRSKVKLRALDEMWTAMVISIGWDSPPLRPVASFSVRLEEPAALRSRLEMQCACSSLVVPKKAPWKTEFRVWDRRWSGGELPKQLRPRSAPPAPDPQTLALRLKRKRCAGALLPPPPTLEPPQARHE